MRIGIVVDKFPSISETFILNKVEGLCSRGHQVIVFRNSRHNDSELEMQLQQETFTNLTVVDMMLPINPMQATRQLLLHPSIAVNALRSTSSGLKKKVLNAIRNEYFSAYPCDIYHFEFSGLAIQYLPLIKTLEAKTVVSCRGTAEKVKAVTQPKRKEELQQLFSVISKIHCVSDDMAGTAISLGASPEKIFVNRPAIHTSFFHPVKKIKGEILQVISVGRLTFQKGYLPGLLAFKEVVKSFSKIHWTIAGDGPMREELQFYINDLGLNDHVTLPGAVTKQQVFNLYQQADLFFLPSVYEGIANVALEAMAMELPVVSPDCSGMKEVIDHDINGLLVSNYDILQMAAAILSLVNEPGKRERLGTAARKKIEASFSIKRQLDVFENEYQQS